MTVIATSIGGGNTKEADAPSAASTKASPTTNDAPAAEKAPAATKKAKDPSSVDKAVRQQANKVYPLDPWVEVADRASQHPSPPLRVRDPKEAARAWGPSAAAAAIAARKPQPKQERRMRTGAKKVASSVMARGRQLISLHGDQ